MATGGGVVVTPVAVASPAGQNQHLYHYLSPFTATATTTTPSPYVNSSTSATHWISRPSLLRHLNLLLRLLGFVLSFASSLSLALPSPRKASGRQRPFSFQHHSEFRYCIGATIIASFYCALQLFKGIWDIAFKGFLVPDKVSDYITFFFDQDTSWCGAAHFQVLILGFLTCPSVELIDTGSAVAGWTMALSLDYSVQKSLSCRNGMGSSKD
ncbi:hypothetical protein OPV22_026716 [Ensete ventricosum]|uniref:CASP-like protein n=1 Tax=Ensete ventricosum TaxID=4639 RepID=A0AAV8PYB6_ENSVE|nr:hypothetical protein OPV22_026716 [Ensete ventricosum]